MKNLILFVMCKMWLAFVGTTYSEDTEEVYLVDAEQIEQYDEMNYTDLINYEKDFVIEDEEISLDFESKEMGNGDVFYYMNIQDDTLYFTIVCDESFNVWMYEVYYY